VTAASNTLVKDLRRALGAPKKRSIALILSPTGIILLSAARLIIVANYNTTTAITIASSGGYINAFLGSVIPLVPVFAPYLALLFLLLRRWLLSVVVFIFAAFITPTATSLLQLQRFAEARWHTLLLGWYKTVPAITGTNRIDSVIILAILFALLVRPLWAYHRSVLEAAAATAFIVVLVALLFTGSSRQLPVNLRLASAGEGKVEHQVLSFTAGYRPLAIGILLVILLLAWANRIFPHILAIVVALVAAVALLPYVYNAYPLPQGRSYYSEVLHELWLPAEKIVTHSGHVYYGYILTSDPSWDTVLLTSRRIVYLHEGDVVSRSVCQPVTTAEPNPYPPLIPWLYTKPSPTPACTRNPSPPTTVPFVLSHGQSLKEVAGKVHTWPWHIIFLTNAAEHGHISAALRAYERRHNWNAATPKDQHFWFNPPRARKRRPLGHVYRSPVSYEGSHFHAARIHYRPAS
jgi:hypothetical protein